jgi:hypothetical protein
MIGLIIKEIMMVTAIMEIALRIVTVVIFNAIIV